MYFAELSRRYTTRQWYFVLRGVIGVLFGVMALSSPSTAAGLLATMFSVWLLVNGLIQVLPVVTGRLDRPVWTQALGSGLPALVAGTLILVHDTFGLRLIAIILGLLLIFRGMLALVIFVEAPISPKHQRLILFHALASSAIGVVVFVSPFRDNYAFERLLGLYAIAVGISHILNAWRITDQMQASEASAHTLMSQSRLIPLVDASEFDIDVASVPQDNDAWQPAVPGRRLDPTQYRRPIIFAPHPDDLEGFVGGLVYMLPAEVLSVVFAGGDKGVWSPDHRQMEKADYIRLRLDEAVEAGRLLGVSKVIYMGFNDRGVECTEAAIERVVEILDRHRPDLVVSFEFYPRATLYPHPDHMAAANVIRHAVARYQHSDRLDYLVTSTLLPNVFLDVTGVRRVKLEALACHTTQVSLNNYIFPFLEKMTTRLWGAFNGVGYAEGFRLIDVAVMKRKLSQNV